MSEEITHAEKRRNDQIDHIYNERRRLGWTQAQMAKKIGVHSVSYSLWESGKKPMPTTVRLACERIFDQS